MAKMNLRSSPAKDPKKESPLKSQGVTKNPSLGLCRFTNPKICRIRHCVPAGTVFRSFDSSMKSDCVSDAWITFPATPFVIGFNYPFPALTQAFFTLTSMCYIQAMPMMWITYPSFFCRAAISLSHIQETPATKERIAAFGKLDPDVITFQAKTKDSQEISSGSYTMSSDLNEFASSRSIKKELAASPSIPNPKDMSTRRKGAKKRKTAEPTEGLPLIQHQFEEYVSEVRILNFAENQMLLDQHLEDAEQKNLDFQQMFLAKDKKISSLEKEVNLLQKEVVLAQITAQQEMEEVMEGAKLSATIDMLKIKLQMAKEVEDPAFHKSSWDQEAWRQRLAELDDEDEAEQTATDGAGSSGVKDPVEEAAGKGGEEAAKV
ncbi:hypothetical protein Hdeb2414_s0003g00105311 [Helianthus debilis subsp. tardiflorus]